MPKPLRIILFTTITLFCALNLLIWPVNEYEWMLAEDPTMTLPIDHDAGATAVLAILPVFTLLLFLIGADKQARRNTLVVFAVLLLFGLYKYRSVLFISA